MISEKRKSAIGLYALADNVEDLVLQKVVRNLNPLLVELYRNSIGLRFDLMAKNTVLKSEEIVSVRERESYLLILLSISGMT